MTTNFIKNIADKKITEEVHHAFVRYSLGEFVKEPFIIKKSKKDISIKAGFEYLNLLHAFLGGQITGDVELEGVIETVRDLSLLLSKLSIQFEEEKRFGKKGKKYVLPPQAVSASVYKKLVDEAKGEYLLFNISAAGARLKVKSKTTPKLGSATNDFVQVKLPPALFPAFRQDYLFDIDVDFTQAIIEQTYFINDIGIDKKLLEKDADAARRKALRQGEIRRKITVDGKLFKEYKITFKV
ncbi:hypothetical protein HYX14_03945 [Candidatus Woesearchaeota archaeon]|nr:hypothetical protein [Candidatus Woesearchaeota archaeon]